MSNVTLVYLEEVCESLKFMSVLVAVMLSITLIVLGKSDDYYECPKRLYRTMLGIWVLSLLVLIFVPAGDVWKLWLE